MTWIPDDATVEKTARALYAINPRVDGEMGEVDWDHTTNDDRDYCREQARAALLAVVPEIVAEAVKAEAAKVDDIVEGLRDLLDDETPAVLRHIIERMIANHARHP